MDFEAINNWAKINANRNCCIITAKDNGHVYLDVCADDDIPNYIDLAHVTTERDYLYVLKVVNSFNCCMYYPNLVNYYTKMNFMQCLNMLMDKFPYFVMPQIRACAIDNLNILSLDIVKPHMLNKNASQMGLNHTYPFPIHSRAIEVHYNIVNNMRVSGSLQYVPLPQRKLLSQYAFMCKYQHTLLLIESFVTPSDYNRLLLLKHLFTTSQLQDVYYNNILFLFMQSLWK